MVPLPGHLNTIEKVIYPVILEDFVTKKIYRRI